MKINIVNLDKDGWILTKFAKNIYRELKKKGLEVFFLQILLTLQC